MKEIVSLVESGLTISDAGRQMNLTPDHAKNLFRHAKREFALNTSFRDDVTEEKKKLRGIIVDLINELNATIKSKIENGDFQKLHPNQIIVALATLIDKYLVIVKKQTPALPDDSKTIEFEEQIRRIIRAKSPREVEVTAEKMEDAEIVKNVKTGENLKK